MASQKQQYTILYGRLSQEDERAGESNSIQHQRELLEKYAQDKGFENTLFLADDGYSGTNFERPSWKKIVEMIEAGEVSTLIVKDASRLGREYLQVGYYMEIYFPQKNVRFIAVNDGVDSAVESSNDFNPIRNWANELHAKDTSRKVRAVKKLQAERKEQCVFKALGLCVTFEQISLMQNAVRFASAFILLTEPPIENGVLLFLACHCNLLFCGASRYGKASIPHRLAQVYENLTRCAVWSCCGAVDGRCTDT